MSTDTNVFDSLVKPIRDLIRERRFTDPTDPQSEAIPLILDGRNVLLISPTSTGKTEAAFLPVLQMIISAPRTEGIKLIYVTPLRALNRDLLDRLLWWCGKLDLGVSVRHGDTGVRERREQALRPPDIMITTPETLQILLNGRLLRQHLKSVRWVIVDEVHELADSKRGTQLSLSLEKLRWTIGGDFQVVGLSATVGTPERVAKFLVGDEREFEIVYVPVGRTMILEIIYPEPEAEDHYLASKIYTFPEVAARLRAMKALLEEYGSTLLFTNTRPMSEILTSRFRIWDLGFPVSVHHGSLSSLSRMRAEKGLKGGSLKGVICTSSLELGLDVGTIELCIQYNSPRQVTRLIQRVGRSGHRVGGTARGVIVVQNSDDALESLVIAKRALEEELEPVSVPEKPLDVLMHELTGLLIVKRRWNLDEAYGIVREARPYRNLERGDLERVLEYMCGLAQRLVWFSLEEEVFSRSKYKRLFKYYYDNLSMIPVVKQFLVINEAENLPVGILDEEFVTENGEPGIKFVMGGSVWRIVQVFRDRVYVKPDPDPIGAIPSWVGEEIPVPFSVAQEVGAIRRRVEELVRDGKVLGEISKILSEEYPADPGMIARTLEETYQQLEAGLMLPTDRRMTVERWGKMLILHSSCGTLTNRTIARYLGHNLMERVSETVSVFEDPYRIFIVSEHVSPEELMDALREGSMEELGEILRSSIEASRFFKRRLSQVARRMGAVRRDVELTSSLMNQLMKGLKDTPVFDEAFQEVVQKDLHFKGAVKVLEEIREGEVELISLGEREEATPIAQVGLKWMSGRLENVSPDRLRVLAVASTRARLLSELRTLVCTNCKKYVEEKYINGMDEGITCPICDSPRVGMVEESEEDVYRMLDLIGRTAKGSSPRKIWRRALDTASLISSYGKKAAIVLASESLSIDQAKEILIDVKEISGRLFEAINEAERTNIMKRFSRG